MQKLNSLYLHDISNSNQVVKYITGKYWNVDYIYNIFMSNYNNNLKINVPDLNDFVSLNYLYNYYENYNYSELNFVEQVNSDSSFQINFWIKPYNNWLDVSKNDIIGKDFYILGSGQEVMQNDVFFNGGDMFYYGVIVVSVGFL